ncbi:hypothetical protein QK292_05605 [Arthrobacter sp. AL08]|uniref:hypothetical protein n=1 Tax=unclassified Arthrobacter TaxID=235627 RepID=UPI00249C95CA|nr:MULTISPECIES: hypothetical protein [unclassified Arthrobacter]MDI3240973.1 hypothetical protein [Arthrobacter sp. AL05]MDI3277051.1 hypothetical protein [Arthrobacter sp. AL08]
MNHKLRVLVRVEAGAGTVTLEVTGCLTQADFPSLLHIIRRAGRLGAGTDVIIDLHKSSHLDPEILLELRSMADTGTEAFAAGAGQTTEPFRMTLAEPAELPICLLHVGSDGEVLAGLEAELAAGQPLDLAAEPGASPAVLPAGPGLPAGVDEACGPAAAELNAVSDPQLTEYFEGTLDPAATVRALSDMALGQLADALYRHLDTNSPSFGAHTWYELATEELQQRHHGAAGDPEDVELPAGQGPGLRRRPAPVRLWP